MNMKVEGRCHCGAVEFIGSVDPRRVGICHCTDCQIFSGSAFRTSVMVRSEDFDLRRGEPASYSKTAESGEARQLVFCRDCGTHLYGAPAGSGPGWYSVRVGVLAQRADLAPVVQIWCRSELAWLQGLSGLPRRAQQ